MDRQRGVEQNGFDGGVHVTAHHKLRDGCDERNVAFRNVSADIGNPAQEDHRGEALLAPGNRFGPVKRQQPDALGVQQRLDIGRAGRGREGGRVNVPGAQGGFGFAGRHRQPGAVGPLAAISALQRGGERTGAGALRAYGDPQVFQVAKISGRNALADEHPERFLEQAAEGAQRLFFGNAGQPALHQRDIDEAFFEQAEIVDRTGSIDQFNLHALLGEQALVALGIGVIGAARCAGAEADGLRRRRIHQEQGNHEAQDGDGDHRSVNAPHSPAPHGTCLLLQPLP